MTFGYVIRIGVSNGPVNGGYATYVEAVTQGTNALRSFLLGNGNMPRMASIQITTQGERSGRITVPILNPRGRTR